MTNALNWFEIPTTNIDRAAKFYGVIFDSKLEVFEMYPGFRMAMFAYEPGKGVGGAIVQGEGYAPSTDGTVVYLNGGRGPVGGVESRRGCWWQGSPKQDIGENGFVGMFLDSEGNKVGLHSNSVGGCQD